MTDADLVRKLKLLEERINRHEQLLSRHTLVLPFTSQVAQPINATSDFSLATPPHHSILIREYSVSTYVATTNNASNYWTIQLYTYDGSGAAVALDGTSFTTASDTASAWTQHSMTGLAVTVADGIDLIAAKATKTLGAGAFYWASIYLEYTRL